MKYYLKKMINSLIMPSKILNYINELKYLNFQTTFIHEGNTNIKIPKVNILDGLTKPGRNRIFQAYLFSGRPRKEVLLRKIVFDLFQKNFLDKNNSIIDIGCWIGDNSLVWSKLLYEGKVFAIDPIKEAIEYASLSATINNINNIDFRNVVCSDVSGISLVPTGVQGGISFSAASFETDYKSTTIDKTIPENEHGSISLFHIDVEGFEEKVILGAMKVISRSRPVVIYERHISSEDTAPIENILKGLDYEIYMVNEVIPGCQIDCRNFIAFDSKKPLPAITNWDNFKGVENDIWYATLGPSLVRVK